VASSFKNKQTIKTKFEKDNSVKTWLLWKHNAWSTKTCHKVAKFSSIY